MWQDRPQETGLSGKLVGVTQEGQSVAKDKDESQTLSTENQKVMKCVGCLREIEQAFHCKSCHTGCYCSKECQTKCWKDHKVLCKHIADLESQVNSKAFAKVNYISNSSFTPNEEMKLAKLIGRKCTVDCFLDGVKSKVLWDTGAQVTIVSKSWLDELFPEKELKDVSELLGHELFLTVANNTRLDFLGYVEIVFKLADGAKPVLVPFLVTEEVMDMPLVGSNAIEEIVKKEASECEESIVEMVKGSFEVTEKNAKSIVNLIQKKAERSENETLGEVKVGGKDVVVPRGSNLKLKCIARCGPVKDTAVMFQPDLLLDLESGLVVGEGIVMLERGKTKLVVPVSNPTGKDIVLRAKTQVGIVVPVASVIPCPIQVNSVNASEETEEPTSVPSTDDENEEETEHVTEPGENELLSQIDLSHLTKSQQRKVKVMLLRMSDAFAKDSKDIGEIKDLKMKIKLKDDIPVKRAYTSIPKPLYKEVKEYVEDLIASGWVQKSYSSYSSPMVCVRKKDGSLRLCIDYRQLNNKTIPDSQPIPKVQDILNNLGGNRWFTTLDMAKAYHQGFIHEDYRHLTAFATPWSLLEWVRIPFGLMNAPPYFQRYMNECLVGVINVICVPYLDDVLGYSKTFSGHLRHVETILRRFIEHGIKLNPKKCVWFKKSVKYLGHVVSEEGYQVEGASDEVIDRLKEPPKTVGDVRSLLGFIGYYRSFIQNFSQKAKPLYDLLCKPNNKANPKQTGKNGKAGNQRSSKDAVVWLEEHQAVLDSLLELLKKPPVMAYPDFSLPFIVTCDASEMGLGAVLYQEQDGKQRVVGYASRTLTPAEKNYYLHSGKLEFLALKWSVTDRFHDYLYYAPSFTVYTDCNPLSYILTSAKLNATTIRWVGELANYHFNIKYRPGKISTDCDYLSRHSIDTPDSFDECQEEITSDMIGAIVAGSKQRGKFASVNAVNTVLPELGRMTLSQLKPEELRADQRKDIVIGKVLKLVERKKYPSKMERKQMDKKARTLVNQWSRLEINENGVLMRKTKHRTQVVLPEKYRNTVYDELHCKMGHLSVDRVVQLVQDRFYWPYLAKDVEHYVHNVCQCLKRKKPNREQRAPLVNIRSSEPFEIVSVDFVHLDKSKGGYEYLLVLVDHFTRFVQVYPTRNRSGRTAADKIFNEYILRFGFPKRLHHDQGGEFENKLFTRLHELCGIEASRTTPYHPQGDGQVERMNRTLINMLKTLPDVYKSNWKDHVNKLVFAYNSTRHDATTYSPFQLLFGRSPRLPIDFMFNLHQENEPRSYGEYVNSWKKAFQEACVVASKHAKRNAETGKRAYDKKMFGATLEVGDRVLVKNMSERGGTGKLRSYWENDVHVIVSKKSNDMPVYVVKAENGTGGERVLHRNMLLPCQHLPLEIPMEGTTSDPKEKKKAVPDAEEDVNVSAQPDELTSDVDDEDDDIRRRYVIGHVLRQRTSRGDQKQPAVSGALEDSTSVSEDNVVISVGDDAPTPDSSILVDTVDEPVVTLRPTLSADAQPFEPVSTGSKCVVPSSANSPVGVEFGVSDMPHSGNADISVCGGEGSMRDSTEYASEPASEPAPEPVTSELHSELVIESMSTASEHSSELGASDIVAPEPAASSDIPTTARKRGRPRKKRTYNFNKNK